MRCWWDETVWSGRDVKSKIDHIVGSVMRRMTREEYETPKELYAYSCVIVGERGWMNIAGITLTISEEDARESGVLGGRQLYAIDNYGKEKAISVHVHKLDEIMLEVLKQEYNLKDNLDLWRRELSKENSE
jgi:hypothetical protein